MMLRDNSLPNPAAISADFELVLEGQVSPALLWEKHSIVISVLAFLALVVLLMIKRLLFGRRRRVAA